VNNIVINKCPSSRDININIGSGSNSVSISQAQESEIFSTLSCSLGNSSGISNNPNVQVIAGVYRGLLSIFENGVGGSSGIYIFDESENLGLTNQLVFSGSGVKTIRKDNKIYVYIPPLSLASSFNSNDNATDATINEIQTYNRYLSNPINNAFNIGGFNSGDLIPSINSSSISFSTNDYFGIENLNSKIISKITDFYGNTISAKSFDITGNFSGKSNGIDLIISNFSEDSYQYKAKFSSTFYLDEIIPSGGIFSIILEHSGDNINYFSQTGIFYDTDANKINFSNPVVSSGVFTSNKKISGIKYLTLGDSLKFVINNINNLNCLTYLSPFGTIESYSQFGISNFNLTKDNIIGWNANFNISGLSFNEDRSITRNSYRYFGNSNGFSRIGCKFYDWTDTEYLYSSGINVLIDTYSDLSSDYYEPFDGESKRIKLNYSGWNSSELLTDKDLMIHNGKLQRQSGIWNYDFPFNNIDYSTNTNTQYYIRGFKKDNTTKTNGIFYIDGISESNLSNNDVIIWISLNGSDWYNCNLPWGGGSLNSGDGCRINSDSKPIPELEFTLGGAYTSSLTGPSGWGIYCKVEMPSGSNVQIGTLEIENWI